MTNAIGNEMKEPMGIPVIDLTPSSEIITTCDHNCKMLTEALLVQQKMTKLLIGELKQDQNSIVEKVKEEVTKSNPEQTTMPRLLNLQADMDAKIKRLTGNNKFLKIK